MPCSAPHSGAKREAKLTLQVAPSLGAAVGIKLWIRGKKRNPYRVALPEFQRDFVWDIEKTFDLFDSFVRDIFVGSLIYGVPSFEITVRELDRRPRSGRGSRARFKLSSYTREEIENRVKVNGFRLLLDGQQRATSRVSIPPFSLP
jgi:uncharacterized protein with ParB-like and HNH nuclease domain